MEEKVVQLRRQVNVLFGLVILSLTGNVASYIARPKDDTSAIRTSEIVFVDQSTQEECARLSGFLNPFSDSDASPMNSGVVLSHSSPEVTAAQEFMLARSYASIELRDESTADTYARLSSSGGESELALTAGDSDPTLLAARKPIVIKVIPTSESKASTTSPDSSDSPSTSVSPTTADADKSFGKIQDSTENQHRLLSSEHIKQKQRIQYEAQRKMIEAAGDAAVDFINAEQCSYCGSSMNSNDQLCPNCRR